jgi:hypothetical protein
MTTSPSKLDGPTIIWGNQLLFFIDGVLIANEINQHLYWNHPEVKKYMLLKALKELK